MIAKDFIGEGIAYPLIMDSTGRLALVSGVENVERSMRLILGTAYGERPMRPDFGCGIHDLVFAEYMTLFLRQLPPNSSVGFRSS